MGPALGQVTSSGPLLTGARRRAGPVSTLAAPGFRAEVEACGEFGKETAMPLGVEGGEQFSGPGGARCGATPDLCLPAQPCLWVMLCRGPPGAVLPRLCL